jgi:hypothetical protein
MKKTDLQKCFDDFNFKYFNNRLHDVVIRWSKSKTLTLGGEKIIGYCQCSGDIFKPNEIVISKNLFIRKSKWLYKLILLHEMIHLDLFLSDKEDENNHHGPMFNREMLRLAKKGAFVGIW